jgi:predicted metal-binding membrane protein
MTGTATTRRWAPAAVPRRWHTVRIRGPEWWLWAVAGAGWVVILTSAVLGVLDAPSAPAATSGHAGHHHTGAQGVGLGDLGLHSLAWLAMVAVMAPLIARNVRYVAMRSPGRDRAGVSVDVVAGWALAWGAAAIVLGVGTWLLAGSAGELAAIGLLTGIAVAWQYSSRKRLSLARCHRVLAPPLDRQESRRVSRRFGVGLGRDCVLSCWPLMALMAVAGHNPLVVASSVGVAWYERCRRPHHAPGTRETSLVIAATGATALVAAYLL